MAVLTLRAVRSFEYRNVRRVLVRDIDLTRTTGAQLKNVLAERVEEDAALAPLRGVKLDSLKIHQLSAHRSKSTDLVVDLSHDDWFIGDDDILADRGVEDEAEISAFSAEDYERYRSNPEVKW